MGYTTSTALKSTPPLRKGKEKKVYPTQSMTFAPIQPGIYPSDLQMLVVIITL